VRHSQKVLLRSAKIFIKSRQKKWNKLNPARVLFQVVRNWIRACRTPWCPRSRGRPVRRDAKHGIRVGAQTRHCQCQREQL